MLHHIFHTLCYSKYTMQVYKVSANNAMNKVTLRIRPPQLLDQCWTEYNHVPFYCDLCFHVWMQTKTWGSGSAGKGILLDYNCFSFLTNQDLSSNVIPKDYADSAGEKKYDFLIYIIAFRVLLSNSSADFFFCALSYNYCSIISLLLQFHFWNCMYSSKCTSCLLF